MAASHEVGAVDLIYGAGLILIGGAVNGAADCAPCACGFCGPESACTARVATARAPTSISAARTEEPRLKREGMPP